MMRVISSPSISTTGFFTLIFAIADLCERRHAGAAPRREGGERRRALGGGSPGGRRYSTGGGGVKGVLRRIALPSGRAFFLGSGAAIPAAVEHAMSGAGTDKTRNWIEGPGPIVILVEPQLGENIGAAARVMANFGLARLRLVNPRDGWPNVHARRAASGADRVLDRAATYASLNLAQAVALVAYEWFKLASGAALPFVMPRRSEPAPKEQLQAFFANLERQLDLIEYFRPLDKRATMLVNLRNIFARMQPTRQDVQTLHGIVVALTEGRKGPARGGVLDSEEAKTLRALLAEYSEG